MSGGSHAEHHGPKLSTYYSIFISLAILTVVTVAASRVHLPPIGAVILAFVIAMGKATLVMAFFMHLKYDPKVIHLMCIVPVILTIGLMLALMPDVGMVSPGTAGDPKLVELYAADPADEAGHADEDAAH